MLELVDPTTVAAFNNIAVTVSDVSGEAAQAITYPQFDQITLSSESGGFRSVWKRFQRIFP
jgi:hypothetical protein